MLLLTLGLMLTRPALVGPAPHRPAKRLEALRYSERALAFTVLLIGSLVGSGVGAIKLVRLANQEYRRLAMENMQAMISGAIGDQKQVVEKKDEQRG